MSADCFCPPLLRPCGFNCARQRTNVLTIDDRVNVRFGGGVYNDVPIVAFRDDLVVVRIDPDLGDVPIPWSDVR